MADEGSDVGEVADVDLAAMVAMVLYRGAKIARVPQHDGVEDEAEGTELVLLAGAVGLVQIGPAAHGRSGGRGRGGLRCG